jgi:hypothetical protein
VKAEESDDVARLKGDIRMASVVSRLCNDKIGRAADDMELLLGRISVRVPASVINRLLRGSTTDATTMELGRKVFRQRLADAVYQRYTYAAHGVAMDQEDFLRALSGDSTFRRTVDRLFPAISPPAVVREMLTNARVLAQCSDGILRPLGTGTVASPEASSHLGLEVDPSGPCAARRGCSTRLRSSRAEHLDCTAT